MREWDTRLVPHEPAEVSYALNRPDHERTPIPKPGDRVYYRRHMWDQHPTLATVLAVADLEDRGDPHLWHLIRDLDGNPVLDGDVPRMVRAPDPLPWVDLRADDVDARDEYGKPVRCTHCGWFHRNPARTWEARVRGMPGWLPLNWRDRDVKLPSELVHRPIAPAMERWRLEQAAGEVG